MRRTVMLATVASVLTILVACGGGEPEPQSPRPPAPVPTAAAEPVGEIASEDLAVKVSALPRGLRFNQVEPGAMSFFLAEDGSSVVELNLLPGLSAGDLQAAEDAVAYRDQRHQYGGQEIVRESIQGPHGEALWIVWRHSEDGDERIKGWLLSPHPDGNRMVSVTATGAGDLDPAALLDRVVSLLSALEPLS